jgi:hypothetical protein
MGSAGPKCAPLRPIHTDEVPDVASLKTPESPAFMALGTASQIQRPTTPTGLAASVANGVADGKGLTLLRNFALEFSPYWLLPHPTLSFDQLLAQPARAAYRNLSISIASGEDQIEVLQADGTTTDVEVARAAAGLRVTLWPGTPSVGAQRCVAYLKSAVQRSTLAFSDEKRSFLAKWDTENPKPKLDLPPEPNPADFEDDLEFIRADEAWRVRRARLRSGSAYQAFLAWRAQRDAAVESFLGEYRQGHPETDASFSHCLAAIHAKRGFMAESAGAASVVAPEGDLRLVDDDGQLQWTGWLTAGYVMEDLLPSARDALESSVLFALRVAREKSATGGVSVDAARTDLGLRIAVARQRSGLALEGSVRRQKSSDRSEAEWLYRAALSLDYRVSGGMWLSGTFGKDFGDTEDETPLLALANLQWSFGLDRGIQVDTSATRATAGVE